MADAIVVENVGKKYRRYHESRPDTFISAFVQGFRRMGAAETFWGLKEISFSVKEGQALGIIGDNGAGKSTLLRVLGLVTQPDVGTVTVKGNIGGFLDLTAGFRDELTGRENVYVSGVIAGLTRREVTDRFAQIVDFAEIGPFIDSPLRTYSSGMRMRLAFAVAAHTSPDILLIDEVLTVGDLAFRAKCFARIEQFRRDGTTIVLVSHNMNEIVKLCTELLWLDQGRMVAFGEPQAVLRDYYGWQPAQAANVDRAKSVGGQKAAAVPVIPASERRGNHHVKLDAVHFLPVGPEGGPMIRGGEALQLRLSYRVQKAAAGLQLQVSIVDEAMRTCWRTHKMVAEAKDTMQIGASGTVQLTIERLDLAAGRYYVNFGLYSHDWTTLYDLHWRLHTLKVQGRAAEVGWLNPPHYWEAVGAAGDRVAT